MRHALQHPLSCSAWLSALFMCIFVASPQAFGQSLTAPVTPVTPETATSVPLRQVLRGLYADLHAGWGYTLKDQQVPADPRFPQRAGSSEMLGLLSFTGLTLGYDLSPSLSLEALAGMHVVANRLPDRVRGLNLAYLGLGVRLSYPLSERWMLHFAPHVAFARSDTVADTRRQGLAILASVGTEYYVHVRHVSVGADLALNLPLTPLRAFVGLAPHVRYTF